MGRFNLLNPFYPESSPVSRPNNPHVAVRITERGRFSIWWKYLEIYDNRPLSVILTATWGWSTIKKAPWVRGIVSKIDSTGWPIRLVFCSLFHHVLYSIIWIHGPGVWSACWRKPERRYLIYNLVTLSTDLKPSTCAISTVALPCSKSRSASTLVRLTRWWHLFEII